MKTVKFSLNELMSEIDESFIEEVYFHDCNKILKKYSKQKIRQNVFCKTASKHKPLKFTYRTAIIVTVVSVFLCMPVYAAISHLFSLFRRRMFFLSTIPISLQCVHSHNALPFSTSL